MREGNVFSLVSVSLLTEAWADLHVTTTHDAPAPPSLTIRGPLSPSNPPTPAPGHVHLDLTIQLPRTSWKAGGRPLTERPSCYHLQRSCDKVIFSQVGVKNSVRGCLPQCMVGYTPRADTPRQTPLWADTPRQTPQADTPLGIHSPADGYCSEGYASYWNAFLLSVRLVQRNLLVIFAARWNRTCC